MNNNLEISDIDREYIRMACEIASENIDFGGGPFGAVIVKDGKIISTGGNTVTLANDPTAHASINALRRACSSLGSFRIDGCVAYLSCEPCLMCLCALYWAGVSRIYYANKLHDAPVANFNDGFIYKEIDKLCVERSVSCIHVNDPHALDHFHKWKKKSDKIEYK